MIVTNLDIVGVAVQEAEANSPLIVDCDRVLASAILFERVKAIARRHSEIVERRREINILKLPHRSQQEIRREALRGASEKELSRAPIRERLDHNGM